MRRRDAVDMACDDWAIVMRELFGLTHPRLAKDYLGAIRCTLAARRDLHYASTLAARRDLRHASTPGRVEQHFPEYPFRGNAATVNAVYKRLTEPLQEILVAHYVAMTPRSKPLRAELMGLSLRVYWERIGRAKASVDGALAIVETVRTVWPSNRGISGTRGTYL